MLPVLLDRKDHAKTSCAFIKLKPKEFHKTFSFLFLSYFEKIAHVSGVSVCIFVALCLCNFVCSDVCCKSQ